MENGKNSKLEGLLIDRNKSERGMIIEIMLGIGFLGGGVILGTISAFADGLAYSNGKPIQNMGIYLPLICPIASGVGANLFTGGKASHVGKIFAGIMFATEALSFGAGYLGGYLLK